MGLWQLGISPEEIPTHLPHLTLVQVFDALSFYLDNQAEMNDYNAYEIAQRVGILVDSLTADEIANQLLYV